MKKMLIALIILSSTVFFSCSSNIMKNTKTTGNGANLIARMGEIQVMQLGHIAMQEFYYNNQVNEQMRRESLGLPQEKSQEAWNVFLAKKGLYEPNRYYVFTINHTKICKLGKDDFMFSMTDSAGTTIKAVIYLEMDYKRTSSYTQGQGHNPTHYRELLVKRWILKTDTPVTKQNFKDPLTVTIKLFNDYELTYTGEIPDK